MKEAIVDALKQVVKQTECTDPYDRRPGTGDHPLMTGLYDTPRRQVEPLPEVYIDPNDEMANLLNRGMDPKPKEEPVLKKLSLGEYHKMMSLIQSNY